MYQSLGTRMLKIISQFYVHTSSGTLVLLADRYQQEESKLEVLTVIRDLIQKLVSTLLDLADISRPCSRSIFTANVLSHSWVTSLQFLLNLDPSSKKPEALKVSHTLLKWDLLWI